MGSAIKTPRRGDAYKKVSGTLVVYVSPTGNDTNSGIASTKPFRTISKAFSFLSDYHIPKGAEAVIDLASGVYTISSEILVDHPDGARITLRGAEGVVSNITSVSNYTDTSTNNGRIAGKVYKRIRRSYDGGGAETTGQRFDMSIVQSGSNAIPRTNQAVGKFVILSPLDSSYEIQFNYNTNSLANGNLANNTAVKRFSETESTMRRFFSYGGHSIRTNLTDFGSDVILDNRTRNNNIYNGISNSVTSRVNTFSDPSTANIFSSGNNTVSSRYVSSVIKVSGDGSALRIKNSSLKIKDVAFIARDPLTDTLGVSTKSGVIVDDSSTLTLQQGFVVANFDVGLEVKNKSLVHQDNDSVNQYHSFTNCKNGIVVTSGSTAVLNGAVATGCWQDGFVVNDHSTGEFSSCVAIGNGRNGFIATRNSSIVCVRSASVYNMQNVATTFSTTSEGGIGFGSRLNSNIECIGCFSFRNGFGYFADKNSSLNASSSDSMDNVNRAVSVTESSSGVVGPYFSSTADTQGQVITDASSMKTTFSKFQFTGFETPTGVCASAFTIATASNLNVYDVDIEDFSTNAIDAIYSSVITGELLDISENASTQGDGESVSSTYNSVVRLAGSCLGSKLTSRFSLQNGYIELNGLELNV